MASAFLIGLFLAAFPAAAQNPFECTGEAFIVQRQPSQLFKFFQNQPTAFAFQPVGLNADNNCDDPDPMEPGFPDTIEPCNLHINPDTLIEANNMGFRSTAADGGFLYAVWLTTPNGNNGIIRIDEDATVTMLGTPMDVGNGSFPTTRVDAGDVSPDGNFMYINQAGTGTLTIVDLNTFTVVATPTISPVAGAGGIVNDWAFNPNDGNLYGGDRTNGQVARLLLSSYTLGDPTIDREDFNILPCDAMNPPPEGECISPSGLPATTEATGAFGGAWFNSAGQLFVYRNTCDAPPADVCPEADDPDTSGKLYRIDLDLGTLTNSRIVRTRIGRDSEGFNDSAACIRLPPFGPAKRMTAPCGLPSTVTIEYVFENFAMVGDPLTTVSDLSALDDFEEVFGTAGVDWTFTSITSTGPGGQPPDLFHNPNFDGSSDPELINQTLPQSLSAGQVATITVEIEVLTLANANAPPADQLPPGTFCNQILATGVNQNGVTIGDQSTDGLDPDPDGNNEPDEAVPSCVTLADPGVSLTKTGTLDDGGDGDTPGDIITYDIVVTNNGTSTLTDLTVSDPLIGTVTCPSGNPIPSLDPMMSEMCTGTYAITQMDIDNGQVMNTASVNGDPSFPPGPPDPPVCPAVNDSDSHTEPLMGNNPDIMIIKSGSLDPGPDGVANPGDVITYLFTVENTGDVTLNNVTVTDDMVSPIDCSPLVNGMFSLDPGQTAVCTGLYVVTQDDIDNGEKCNIATATGTPPSGPDVMDMDEHCEPLDTFIIPTLGHIGLLLLALGLGAVGVRSLRRKR